MDFAVRVKGIHREGEEKAAWVLAIDGERLLIAHEDKTLHWHALSDCVFAAGLAPDAPRPVYAVQVGKPRPEVLVPNRVMRRSMNGDN